MALRQWLQAYLGLTAIQHKVSHQLQVHGQDKYLEGFKDGTEKVFGVTLPQMTYLRRFWEENDLPWPPSMQTLLRWQTAKEKGEKGGN